MYNEQLKIALDRLFTSKEHNGFWDAKEGKIIESLYHDKTWNWRYVHSDSNRYGLFCIASILMAKKYNNLDLADYKDNFRVYLKYIQNHLNTLSKNDLTYGGLLSLILGIELGYIDMDINRLEPLLLSSCEYALNNYDNQNTLILIPLTLYLLHHKSSTLTESFESLLYKNINSVDKDSKFQTGDIKYCYHQRLMYTLWGLIFSAQHSNTEVIHTIAQNTLRFVWENGRQEDNGFLWHPDFYFVSNRFRYFPIPILNKKTSSYLFECHQTFFAIAVDLYNNVFNEKFMVKERDLALDWIFGANRMNLDLTKITRLGIPNRIMTSDKKLFVNGNNFKGSYEIGSYILALSFQQ